MNGSTWSWTGQTVQYNWTKVRSPQGDQWIARPNSTTVNGTRNFRSVGAVYKTVPAGTFLTLHVEEVRRARQPLFGAADHYYSDAPGNAVQFEFAGQNNTIGGYLNLSSTNYQMKQPK